MRNQDLERAIDDLARGLTAGAVPPVHARAMASLRPRRSPAWRTMTYLASAAVVAAVLVVVIRPSRSDAPSMPAAAPRIASAEPAVAPIAPAVARPASRPAPAARAVTSSSVAPDFGIPALVQPAPLDVAASSPIQPAPLSIPQLTVPPMSALAPLSIPALGEIDRQP